MTIQIFCFLLSPLYIFKSSIISNLSVFFHFYSWISYLSLLLFFVNLSRSLSTLFIFIPVSFCFIYIEALSLLYLPSVLTFHYEKSIFISNVTYCFKVNLSCHATIDVILVIFITFCYVKPLCSLIFMSFIRSIYLLLSKLIIAVFKQNIYHIFFVLEFTFVI